MGDNYNKGNKSLKDAFNAPPEAVDAPEASARQRKEDEDSQQGGGVYESLMNASINVGGALGGGGVYNTLKKVTK